VWPHRTVIFPRVCGFQLVTGPEPTPLSMSLSSRGSSIAIMIWIKLHTSLSWLITKLFAAPVPRKGNSELIDENTKVSPLEIIHGSDARGDIFSLFVFF